MKVTQTLLGFFVLLFSFSCSSDLDFEQVNNLELRPVVVANDVVANKLVNNGSEQSISMDTPDVGAKSMFWNNKNFVRKKNRLIL